MWQNVMELAQRTTIPCGTEVWQVQGPWCFSVWPQGFWPLALGGVQARREESTAQSAVAHSVRTRHLLDLERLALILEGATPAPEGALQEEPGAPAGVASGASSQLCSAWGWGGTTSHLGT